MSGVKNHVDRMLMCTHDIFVKLKFTDDRDNKSDAGQGVGDNFFSAATIHHQ